tara:strand:+ start:26128 stop:27039 length:912 start_codon:yes stop_codon:yes gene_type:complete
MKKIYFLSIIVFAFSFTINAQYDIDFDDMTLGPVSPQSPYIEIWDNPAVTDCNVVNDQSFSSDNSMYVGDNQTDDVVFLLDNKNTGIWTVRFYMYVNSGATGFWNFQDNEITGVQWNGQFFANEVQLTGGPIGQDGFIHHDQTGNEIAFQNDTWFQVKHEINLDNMTQKCWIDGVLFLDDVPYVGGALGDVPANALGSVNYYSIDANNNYYIDDFVFAEGVLSTNDLAGTSFQVYPNPVIDQLNIQSKDAVNTVSIYNVLGKLVHQSSPNSISPSIDMGTYKTGIYFVEVTIGDSTKTVKVIK